MNIYNQRPPNKTGFYINESEPGETLEQSIARMMNNHEPFMDTAPIIYTKRTDGVDPFTNIRTDRFELAVENMDLASKMELAKRAEYHKIPTTESGTEAAK